MAKQNKENIDKNIPLLDKMSKGILTLIDSNYATSDILSKKDSKFQNIINRELELTKGVSNNSIVDFVASLANNSTAGTMNKKNEIETDTDSLFTKDIGDIFGYFQDIYKNKFIEATDLKFISKFIPALGEAVKITLESIISADNISSTISRSIELPPSLDKEEQDQINLSIEKIEEDLKLLKKLKNVVYKKTLITGSFYIYAAAYKDIFAEYQKLVDNGNVGQLSIASDRSRISKNLKKNNKSGFNIGKESNTDTVEMGERVKIALEAQFASDNVSTKDKNKIFDILQDVIPNVSVDNNLFLVNALESAVELENYSKSFGKIEEINEDMMNTDTGTFNSNGRDIASYQKKFSDINGTYIKYIDSKNIIPIKIFEQVVGYYHIHAIAKKKSTSGSNGMVTMSNSLFSSTNLTEQKKESAITNIINTISEGILTQFDHKFVSDHGEYKQIIADCIIANGIVDNDYRIQFIPSDQIIEFKINEDENGNGESMLADSLFPAKLLLSLIICKMLTYMNKSGNKTIAHVYKGPIDVNGKNQLDRVTRLLQESDVTFNDLLSTNLVFSKFTRDSNIQLPKGRNGEKLVEFETQEGQSVDMSTDFEDKLEKMAIIGTGVPTVIMDYIDQADFARQIDSANLRYAGRTASLQTDLEGPTTKLYRIIVKNSNMNTELINKCGNVLKFKLPRPKVLVNANNADFLQNLVSLAETVCNVKVGTSSQDEETLKLKDELMRLFIRQNAPFFDWSEIDELFQQASINVKGKIVPKTSEESSSF